MENASVTNDDHEMTCKTHCILENENKTSQMCMTTVFDLGRFCLFPSLHRGPNDDRARQNHEATHRYSSTFSRSAAVSAVRCRWLGCATGPIRHQRSQLGVRCEGSGDGGCVLAARGLGACTLDEVYGGALDYMHQ